MLDPTVAKRIERIKETCRLNGIPFQVTSTYRSSAKQAELYRAWLARGKTGLPAAPPGRSTHEYGLAFDASFPASKRALVVEIARWFGMVWFGPADPVHFDVYGPQRWSEILREKAQPG